MNTKPIQRNTPFLGVSITIIMAIVSLGCHTKPPAEGNAPSAAAGSDVENLATKEQVRVLGTLPEFMLMDQRGERFGSEQLHDKVWIVTFIFTRCGATCPAQTARFGQLQSELRDHPSWPDIHLVSVTVDPNYDTPGILQAYAQDAGADPTHWTFLTGPRRDVWELSKDGFKLPVYDAPDDPNSLIAHSQRFILVDRQGRIRGYYDGLVDEQVDKLKRDLDRVLHAGG